MLSFSAVISMTHDIPPIFLDLIEHPVQLVFNRTVLSVYMIIFKIFGTFFLAFNKTNFKLGKH